MKTEQLLEEIREANLTYLILAQQMIRLDKVQALFRLGVSEQVADILGNSPEVVRKHYGKWSKGRQANIDRLMFEHFRTAAITPVTPQSHEKTGAVN